MIVKTFLPGVIVNSIRKRKSLNENEWIWGQTLKHLNIELIKSLMTMGKNEIKFFNNLNLGLKKRFGDDVPKQTMKMLWLGISIVFGDDICLVI